MKQMVLNSRKEKVRLFMKTEKGDNAVIGAGSVVTKDIPNDSIAIGNPARIKQK